MELGAGHPSIMDFVAATKRLKRRREAGLSASRPSRVGPSGRAPPCEGRQSLERRFGLPFASFG